MISRRCESCGIPNNVGPDALLKGSTCTACKGILGPLNQPIEGTAATAPELVRRSAAPVLVVCVTSWSDEARAMAPHLRKAAERLAGKALIMTLNAQEHPAWPLQLGVKDIPTTVVTWLGKVVALCPGQLDADKLVTLARQASTLG